MSEQLLKEIKIRPATLEDAAAICHVHLTSVRVLCARDYTPKEIEAWIGDRSLENYRYTMQ
ncbi:MAG: hypothetical protein IGS49_01680 [Chlorogloeopsis fritschii C42_A2020_084]|uniref:hypothetical protein n=1 Tax=Chlorogloeopsis fritschii TaxID=1124 RepID=UPI0019DA3743|nr:hypothetical protein [Chlorogloeopsis fritschii]MBF2004206.1 hypothetical protein [Chlorogloeopsis fritschii C42_A2020_084]